MSLYGEAPAVRRSVVCIGGTIRRAGIERGYNDFVARKTGVIQRAFGPGCFRIDVSGRIDAGASWQLGFFAAHALAAANRSAAGGSADHDVLLWATGTVGNTDLSVGGIGYLALKLQLSAERFAAEGLAGKRVIIAIPTATLVTFYPSIRRSLQAAGAQILELDHVGQLVRALTLPPVVLEVTAAEMIWEGSPFRSLEPFEGTHRNIFFGRGRAREEALERLRRGAARDTAFLLIHGRSGSGKSSWFALA